MNDANQLLSVKELATALGVSRQFVYQMRACGFPMRGRSRHSQRASAGAASKWIQAKNFRLADGRGVVNRPIRAVRPGLRRQAERDAAFYKDRDGKPA